MSKDIVRSSVEITSNGRQHGRKIALDAFRSGWYCRGRSAVTEAVWLFVQSIMLASFFPGSWQRRVALRLFGARIGKGVVIKPRVRVKFPWRLEVGDHCWIGENVWIDNLASVKIGNHCCLSQGAYLCTGSHDWSKNSFDLVVKPIIIYDGVWIGAKSVVAPGAIVGEGAVLSLGSLACGHMQEWGIFQGIPAKKIKDRVIYLPDMPESAGKSGPPG